MMGRTPRAFARDLVKCCTKRVLQQAGSTKPWLSAWKQWTKFCSDHSHNPRYRDIPTTHRPHCTLHFSSAAAEPEEAAHFLPCQRELRRPTTVFTTRKDNGKGRCIKAVREIWFISVYLAKPSYCSWETCGTAKQSKTCLRTCQCVHRRLQRI